jgi:hypothetical protein
MLLEHLKVDNFWDNLFNFFNNKKSERRRERVRI